MSDARQTANFFISYNHRDVGWAEWIAWQLESHGYSTVIQAWDFKVGSNFVLEMDKGLKQAQQVIAVLSPNYLESRFTSSEWAAKFAEDPRGSKIIPIRVQGVPVDGLLSAIIYIDLADKDEEAATHELLAKIKQERAKPLSSPAFPGTRRPNFPGIAHTGKIDSGTLPLKIALLYKRGAEPDETLLRTLEAELRADGNRVFIDRHMTIGVEWAREIERQVRAADAVIPLLSATSVHSEMLAYELQIAHDAAQQNNGKPRILPVRLQCEAPLPDPIGAIVNPIQQALWVGEEHEGMFIAHLIESLHSTTDNPIRSSTKLEAVGGAVPLESPFYIVRPIDNDFISAITRRDSVVLVKGARQVGKTSLLARGLQQARAANARVVLTDLQKFNANELKSIDSFFMTLADVIADQLDLNLDLDKILNPRRGASMNFERFIRRDVLGKTNAYLIWALDEVDRLFTCSYGSEVFGLIRSWHNERSLDPSGPWQQLTLAIAYATEAHLFISDLNQSPFNVGTRLTLSDFTLDQVSQLNALYNSPLQSPSEVARFHQLLGGQPYLVRRGLNEMANHGMRLPIFECQADCDEGLFGDHLRRMLVLLAHDVGLFNDLRAFISDARPLPQDSFYRLRAAGVISGISSVDMKFRCQLYKNYLERHLLS